MAVWPGIGRPEKRSQAGRAVDLRAVATPSSALAASSGAHTRFPDEVVELRIMPIDAPNTLSRFDSLPPPNQDGSIRLR
jgi:hypothetical protein